MEYGSDFSIDLGRLNYSEDNIFAFLKAFNSLYFDSGRSATRYLLQSLKHSIVALPDYLCESIVDCFSDSEIYYYSVNERLQIFDIENIHWDKIDVFYLLHYFGSLQPRHVLDYIIEKKKEFGFIILEDTTHSIFTQSLTIGDYCVCSLRKWFPIPDGGVLYSINDLLIKGYEKLNPIQSERIEGMVLKSMYLRGDIGNKEAFRRILIGTEGKLDRQKYLYRISTISEFILKCQGVNEVISMRRKNHAALKNAIGNLLPEIQTRESEDVPYIYVTRSKNRNALRSYLTQRQVYCPVHWPMPNNWNSERAISLSGQLISIPIDQRYSIHEVENTAITIKGFYNE